MSTTPPPQFLKFKNNASKISNIKIGEIILSYSPSETTKLSFKINNLPIINPPDNYILSTTGNSSIKFKIDSTKRINILSASYWGKNYESCPAPPTQFRMYLLSDSTTTELSYQQNNNNSDILEILFPGTATLSNYGVIGARSNCNLPQNIFKIVIMYTETNYTEEETKVKSIGTNIEYYNSMIGII